MVFKITEYWPYTEPVAGDCGPPSLDHGLPLTTDAGRTLIGADTFLVECYHTSMALADSQNGMSVVPSNDRLPLPPMTPLTETLRAWSQVSDHVVSSMVYANRATAAAMRSGDWSSGSEYVDSVAHERADWTFERTVDDPTAIAVGDQVQFTKTISGDDVRRFAYASGDTNRLHLDDGFAEETRFGGRIAHGTLVSGLISAALARMPGLTVYLSQDLEFVAPVSLGDELTATVAVVESLGGNRFRLETTVDRDDDLVVSGEAVVMIDTVPDGETR